jgi:hypothetical protein
MFVWFINNIKIIKVYLHQGKLVDVEEIHEVLKPVAVLVQQQFLGCPVFLLQQYPSVICTCYYLNKDTTVTCMTKNDSY